VIIFAVLGCLFIGIFLTLALLLSNRSTGDSSSIATASNNPIDNENGEGKPKEIEPGSLLCQLDDACSQTPEHLAWIYSVECDGWSSCKKARCTADPVCDKERIDRCRDDPTCDEDAVTKEVNQQAFEAGGIRPTEDGLNEDSNGGDVDDPFVSDGQSGDGSRQRRSLLRTTAMGLRGFQN